MMEKYRLVEEYRGEGDDFLEEEQQSSVEEVRITHLGKPKNYISYAMTLFVSNIRRGRVCVANCIMCHVFSFFPCASRFLTSKCLFPVTEK